MGTRAERRDTTEAAILQAALKLLAEGGAEVITVRGVARELGLVPSALYRYVRGRDDLISILIAHAFTDLADTVEAAHDAVPAEDLRGRWRAFALTLRRWMLDHPREWMLIQGVPIPGYEPAAGRNYASSSRLHVLLVRLGADAEAAGLRPAVAATTPAVMPGLPLFLDATGLRISPGTALAGLAGWHLLAGALYSEQLRQTGSELVDHDLYYAAMVAASERLVFGDTT